jgi:hypothetical protein
MVGVCLSLTVTLMPPLVIYHSFLLFVLHSLLFIVCCCCCPRVILFVVAILFALFLSSFCHCLYSLVWCHMLLWCMLFLLPSLTASYTGLIWGCALAFFEVLHVLYTYTIYLKSLPIDYT